MMEKYKFDVELECASYKDFLKVYKEFSLLFEKFGAKVVIH